MKLKNILEMVAAGCIAAPVGTPAAVFGGAGVSNRSREVQ